MTPPNKVPHPQPPRLPMTVSLKCTTTAAAGDGEVTLAAIVADTGVGAAAVLVVNSVVDVAVAVESSGEDVAASVAVPGANHRKKQEHSIPEDGLYMGRKSVAQAISMTASGVAEQNEL